jgi:hypothetical protein
MEKNIQQLNEININEFFSFSRNYSIFIFENDNFCSTTKQKLVKNILSNFKEYPVSTVVDFCLNNSISNETFYSEIISPIFIHNNLNDELLQQFLQRQSIVLDKNKNKKNLDPRLLLIIDNLNDKKITHNLINKNQLFISMAFHFKSYCITNIISVNWKFLIRPEIRNCYNYVIIGTNKNQITDDFIEQFYNYWFKFDQLSLSEFKELLINILNDDYFMLINMRKKSSNIFERMYVFKLNEINNFKIGQFPDIKI